MTTAMGLKSIDPKTNEPYVLLAADTRSSLINEKKEIIKTTNVRKIHSNKDNPLHFTYTGNHIEPGKYTEDLILQDSEIKLLLSKEINDSRVIYYLNKINHFKKDNKYAFVTNDLELKAFIDNKFYGNRSLVLFGSGSEKIEKEKVINLEKNLREGISPNKAILAAYQLISNASKKDPGTGGKLNWLLKTKQGIAKNIGLPLC
ncbi:hypothetical protein HN865_03175 [Candidatus Woesearchaeota archaeon]|jgi:hypothetical protein|nr:hypothetical protein [Candidatus Woesearchaeota archaeon]